MDLELHKTIMLVQDHLCNFFFLLQLEDNTSQKLDGRAGEKNKMKQKQIEFVVVMDKVVFTLIDKIVVFGNMITSQRKYRVQLRLYIDILAGCTCHQTEHFITNQMDSITFILNNSNT